MPGTTTTRLALYKPDATGIDNVSVVTDINNNADNLDAKVGWVACTSGTRPGSPYNGQGIRETDTGKYYIWNGAAWIQALVGTAQFGAIQDLGAQTIMRDRITMNRTPATVNALEFYKTGDAQVSSLMRIDGRIEWGPGGAAATDTAFYRSAVGTLKTDTALIVQTDHTINGRLFLGTRRYNNQFSAVTTVAGTAAETVIGTLTIPANDMAVGAIYRIRIRGTAGVLTATTPTMTFRSRISGVAGTAIASSGTLTSSSGVTNKNFEVDLLVSCITIGAAGTIRGVQMVTQTLTIAGAAPSAATQTIMDGGSAAITVDTTASRDLVITAQWGTANAANTLTAYIVAAERVA